MQLQNRHVLITGGSSGIGLALARRCLKAGARITLISRDPAKLAAAAESLRATAGSGSTLLTMPADVARQQEIVAAIEKAEASQGPVEVLVTSAGVVRPGYFEEIAVDDFERTMAVNYLGTVYPVKHLVPAMRRRKAGAIVMISSGAGLHGFFGYTAYSPSKFAIRGFAEALRAELRDSGVQVSVVYPPDTDTPQLAEENKLKPAETKAITAGGGLWTADEVARVTLDGVTRGKFAITPGLPVTALAWFHSLIAPILYWSFDRTARRARDRAGRR